MSNQTITEDLQGTLFWVKLAEVDYGYNPSKLPPEQLDKKAFSYNVEICVSEDDYDAFVAKYPKKASTPKLNEDFKKKYLVDEVPFPDQKKQYTLKFKQKVYNKEGKERQTRPLLKTFQDGQLVDITQTTKVANGSKGRVRYTVFTTPNLPFPLIELKAVCVDELIEYKAVARDPNAFDPV